MYIKKTNAGTLFKNNTGKLIVGLTIFDIAMVKNDKTEHNSPPYKLIQYKPGSNWQKTLCGLFMQQTNTKSYYQGDINLGFGLMRIQLWKNEQIKNDKSPVIYITASLVVEQPKTSTSSNENENESLANEAFGSTTEAFGSTTAEYPPYKEEYNDDEIPF